MKMILNRCCLLIAAILISSQLSYGQKATTTNFSNTKTNNIMKAYVIEREIPGAAKLTPEQLRDISQKSCTVLKDIGPSIKWIRSYVTNDKLYCVYQAESEELVRKHAQLGGFPCNSVQEVANVISPKTAESQPQAKATAISY